jgi:quinoprotein glucose dehydrogenase
VVYTGNAGVWAQMSRRRTARARVSAGGVADRRLLRRPRPGNGLFGETLVAVDLQTGKRKWHYQLVHHGIWDMDIPCAADPARCDDRRRTIKAVAQPTKQAFLYVFNRETGQPIWPIVERPVEKGTVPGEWYSPTQPIPTKPRAYETQGLVTDDLIDFTPELRAEAEKIVSRYKLGPVFTPPVVSTLRARSPRLPSRRGRRHQLARRLFRPRDTNPLRELAKTLSLLGLVPPRDPTKNDLAYVQGNAETGARTTGGSGANAGPGGGGEGAGAPQAPTVRGLPLVKPPYGQISAIDMKRGEILWQIAHGETPDNVRNNPR